MDTEEKLPLQLRLELTYPCEQKIWFCVPDVDKRKVTIVDDDRAQCTHTGINIRDVFGRYNLVPDVDRYRLRLENDRIAPVSHSECRVAPCSNRYYDHDPAVAKAEEETTIVIILESPHEDEYLRDVSQPIAPAQGATGSNIQGWLDRVLQSCHTLCIELEVGTTRVVLSNPIQYQTSLASVIQLSDWQLVRDAVWAALWSCQLIRDDFKARLESYNPDLIINACTHDDACTHNRCAKNVGCKKHKIGSFLAEHFGACSRYDAAHPSSWHQHRSLYRAATKQ